MTLANPTKESKHRFVSACAPLNQLGKILHDTNTWCLAGTHSLSHSRIFIYIYIYTGIEGVCDAAMNLASSRFRGACQVDRFPGRNLQPDNETNYSSCFQHYGPRGSSGFSVPAVVLDHVGQLDDEFALLVLLTAFKGMLLMERRRGRETNSQENVKPKIMDICRGAFLGASIKYNTFKGLVNALKCANCLFNV